MKSEKPKSPKKRQRIPKIMDDTTGRNTGFQDDEQGGEITGKNNYIIPPGLHSSFYDFLAHFEVAEHQPIMIVGETGVGKSIYLRIFKRLFEDDCASKKRKPKIIWANCSHFGNQNSDPNLARSELFGYLKGAFYGADKNTKGLIDKTEGGALILEEIGELPLSVQAMLLTFIETGEYRPVGSTKTKFAKVSIVGATNNEEALRDDFRYRFFPFYIPPLYKRREDVLYYICSKFPELIDSLTTNETLALLAYNWPGNVREIDRVSRLMLRHKIRMEHLDFKTEKERQDHDTEKLFISDERYTLINSQLAQGILNGVGTWEGDTELLESLLNRHRVGLSRWKCFISFPEITDCHESLNNKELVKFKDSMVDPQKQFGVQFAQKIWEFEDAYIGFMDFCGLFGQDPDKNENILADIKNADWQKFWPIEANPFADVKERDLKKLFKAIMHSIMGFQVEGYKYPDDIFDHWFVLEEQKEKHLTNSNKKDEIKSFEEIYGMSENDLLKTYYEGLLERTGGRVKAAAEMVGLKETTFRARLDKIGISYRRSQR